MYVTPLTSSEQSFYAFMKREKLTISQELFDFALLAASLRLSLLNKLRNHCEIRGLAAKGNADAFEYFLSHPKSKISSFLVGNRFHSDKTAACGTSFLFEFNLRHDSPAIITVVYSTGLFSTV